MSTDPTKWRRVAVVGPGGAGKTTVSAHLAAAYGLPIVHLDVLYWRPGWVATPDDEWHSVVEAVAAQERWITDGNFGRTLELRLARADAVVFLDLPRRVTIPSVLRRWLTSRGRSRPDLPEGCPESIDPEFLRWLWDYPQDGRLQVERAIRLTKSEPKTTRLTSRRAVTAWLATHSAP